MKKQLNNILQVVLIALFSLFTNADLLAQGSSAGRLPKPECMGVDHDGSQTILSYGSGPSKAEAIEQAEKNAVYAVLFQGILDGNKGCDVRPVLNEPNVAETYEEFFNRFFSFDGEFHEFIETIDVKRFSDKRDRNHKFVTYTVTVRVYRNELKQRMRDAQILKDGTLL